MTTPIGVVFFILRLAAQCSFANPFRKEINFDERALTVHPRSCRATREESLMATKQKEMYLVEDEILEVGRSRTKGPHAYRVQVYRGMYEGEELPPIVLMLAMPGNPPLVWYTTRLATMAWRQLLGSAMPLPKFFMYCWSLDEQPERLAFRVEFEVCGHPLRPWIREPQYKKLSPNLIERCFSIKED